MARTASEVDAGPGRIRRANETLLLDAAEAVFAEAGFAGASTAAIAARAGLPKANLHYYFGTKEAIYRAVLDRILKLWLAAFDPSTAGDDPAEVLDAYIRAKIRHSHEHPLASRVFAGELLRGAPVIRGFLSDELRPWVERQTQVMRRWIAEGRMDPVDPLHLLFMIWAVTQTYADFDVQIRMVTGKRRQSRADFDAAADNISRILLKGCGIGNAGSRS